MDDKKKDLDRYKWNYKKEIRKRLRIGSFILSQPFLPDEVFKRAVCLMCAHSRAEGSFGFILNKPTEFTVADFIEELDDLELPVYFGGPVATDSLYFLHDNSLNSADAKEILSGVYWGGDFQEMIEKIKNNKTAQKRIKFILGYSGWDPGQLRKEIIEDSWIVADGNDKQTYSDSDNLWKEVMEGMGEIYNHLASLPERPDLN
jgi:putative transcriptional regulator